MCSDIAIITATIAIISLTTCVTATGLHTIAIKLVATGLGSSGFLYHYRGHQDKSRELENGLHLNEGPYSM